MMRGAARRATYLPGLVLGVMGSLAAAATPPDAGQSLRELQQPAPPRAPAQPAPVLKDEAASAVAAGAGSDISIPVRQVTISGNVSIPTVELAALLADLPGRTVTLDQLQAATRRITDYYRAQGFLLARAYLPAQEIRDGNIAIGVLEGTVDKVAVNNSSRVSTPRVEAVLARQLPAGRPVHTDASNRALLLLQQTPGIAAVQGGLRPGSRVGGTEVSVELGAQPLLSGYLAADNAGNRFTGQGRLIAGLNFNSLAGIGDRLMLQGVVSEDDQLAYGRLAWDVPLGSNGLRAGLAAGSTRYELGDAFAPLGAEGTARTGSLYASYPLLLTPEQRIGVNLSLEHRELHDEQASVSFDSRKSADAAVLTFDGSFSDGVLGSNASSGWRVSGTYGKLDLETASTALIDAATARTAGDYGKLTLNLTREQALPAHFSFYAAASGQYAHRNLDSSEQFTLGGPMAIRAYPTGEGVGDQGWLATAELRYYVLKSLRLAGFYDAGGIESNRKPYIPLANGRRLKGGGLALRAEWKDFDLEASLAWRDDDVPTSDRDRHPRGWVSGSWSF